MTSEILETIELLSNRTLETLRLLNNRIEKNGLEIVKIFNDLVIMDKRLKNTEAETSIEKSYLSNRESLNMVHKALELAKYNNDITEDEYCMMNDIQKEVEKYTQDSDVK